VELIDRDAELGALREAARTPPSLVVLRGRRRVGKSFLLSVAFDSGRLVSYQADQQGETGQLAGFADRAADLVGGAPGIRFEGWDQALAFIGTQLNEQPLTVILDEFQYLCASQPALPSIIQRHWDGWQRQGARITLVLCGSALSFMEEQLHHSAPLYGRATCRPLLLPLHVWDTAAFAAPRTRADALVQRYAVLGGTPQYQVWGGRGSLEEVVRRRILAKEAPLYEEPLHLIRAEDGIRDPRRYIDVLAAIATGRTQFNEIAQRSGADTSNLSKVLDRLRELGLIEFVEPVAFVRPRRVRGFWKVSDPFFRFWFRAVFPNRSRLDQDRADAVWERLAPDLDSYVGTVFEDCCRDWLSRRSSLDEARGARRIGSWWSNDPQAEIDIVAVDRAHYTLVGSCKWRRGSVGIDVLDELRRSRALLGGRAENARLVIFARSTFTDQLRVRAEQEGVLLVPASELLGKP